MRALRTLFFLCATVACGNALAVAITISASTNWSAINTGSGAGGQPNNSDTITISGNTQLTVDVPNGAVSAITIGSANTSGARLVFSNNVLVTVSGNVQFGNGGGNRNGSIDMTNGGTLSAGSFSVSNLNAWTPGAGTVILTGTNTLPNSTGFVTFNNLTVSANTTTLSRAITVAGNLVVTGTLAGAQTLTLSGNNTTIDGTGSITITTLSITTGSKLIASSANLSTTATMVITGPIAVTNQGNITTTAAGGITGTVAGTTWTNAANSTLRITGALLTTGTLDASASDNTVIYAGAAQTIKTATGTPATYHHLTLSGSLAKTPAASLRVAGNLTIDSGVTLAGTTLTVTVNGNVSNAGTHTATAATGTITLSGGTASHTLSGSGTYANLVMNDSNGASLTGSPTVSSVLTLTSGVITTSANTLITSASCVAGAVQRSNGHINGNLQLNFPTGAQSCAFHVGDSSSTNYTPVTVTFTNVSAAGGLIGGAASGDYSDSGSPVDTARSVNRYWTLQLPGTGALTFTGSYSTAFTYFATDNDGSTNPAQYIIGKGDSCSPSCTWTLPTISVTPTNTAATATGMTSFSVFVVGHIKIAHFAITIPSSPFSTCNAASITITAQDASNNTVTNYNGTVNISTSPADGDWSLTTGNGTLTNSGPGFSGVADDGKATYNFTPSDNGVVTLSLSNILVNSNVTITVVDSSVSSSSTTSAAIQYRGNQLAITNDTIQVANKPQSMKITRTRGASCSTVVPGDANLKAWYTTDADHPAGATAPAITGASPAITTSVPGSNNLSVTFNGSGEAAITLTTSDVGKYVINVRDDSAGSVNATSPTITTRPFALVVTQIKQGALDNPSGTATAGTKFIAAGASFQATVAGYLWNAAADANNDGVPEGGATLAQIIGGGVAPRFAWPVTLAAATPITPAAGTTGTLSNGSVAIGAFSGGSATPTNLSYSEVGSFTLTASASSYLNTAGANFTAGTNGIVADASSGRSGVIGRFFPDHFAVTASSITAGCTAGANAFTYMGHGALAYTFTIEAQNLANAKTSNYDAAGYTVGSVALQAENSDNGTDLSSRVTPSPAGSWSGGTFTSNTTATFSRLASPDGSFESLQLGVIVSDADGAVLASRDMNPTTPGCGGGCTGKTIGGGTTKVRFGRLRQQNAIASSGAVVMPVPVALQYWNGSVFTNNTDDNCTTIGVGSVTLSGASFTPAGSTSPQSVSFSPNLGTGFIRLAAPGAGNKGFVAVTPTVPSYLQGNWTGSTWDQNPTNRAAWGVFGSQPPNFVFQRENY